MSRLPDEWCDRCRATVPVRKVKGVTACDYCDLPLFDAGDNEIVYRPQEAAR